MKQKRVISFLLALTMMLNMVLSSAMPAFAADTDNETTETVNFQVVSSDEITNDQRFEAYATQLFYGSSVSTLGDAAGEMLSADAKVLYDGLKPVIKQIAAGERASAKISLGQTYNDGTTDVVPDAVVTLPSVTEEMVFSVIDALLSDMPYEMYWYDKVTGCSIYSQGATGMDQLVFAFTVAANYRGADEYTADTAVTGAAPAAVANAQDIIDKYADVTDYEKLVGYKDEICALVSYNQDAADTGSFTTDNDPWQLIYVFDGDADTNVVCEGYSKAFMYLCDMTTFTGDVTCYIVSGTMNDGAHMWNIITIEGKNYLADVTNSDENTSGSDGSQFMKGVTGTATEGYTVNGISYVYDDDTTSLWGTGDSSILNVSLTDYSEDVTEPEATPTPEPTVEPTPEPSPDATYTVTFDNGNADTVPSPQEILRGNKVVAPNKIGDTFKNTLWDHWLVLEGYYTDSEYTQLWDIENDVVTEDITLYMNWIYAYSVNYDYGTYAEADTEIVIKGDEITTAPEKEIPGYVITGWYFDSEFTDKWEDNTAITVDKDITVYAKLERKADSCIVTFKPNIGTTCIEPIEVEVGGKVAINGYTSGTSEAPSPYTYILFKGEFFKDIECTQPWDIETDVVTEDITLYQKWYPAHIVYFDYGDYTRSGHEGFEIGRQVTYQDVINKSCSVDGYVVEGWYFDPEFTDRFDREDTVTLDGSLTLYAKFIEGYSVHISYNLETEDNTSEHIVYDYLALPYGEKVPEPEIEVPEGYNWSVYGWEYNGWSEDNGYMYGYWDFENDTVICDISISNSLYMDDTVTFDTQGKDVVIDPVKVIHGTKLTSLPTAESDGYCLTGWYHEPECINPVTIEHDEIYEDVTIYAKWEKLAATSSDLPTEPETSHTVEIYYSIEEEYTLVDTITVDTGSVLSVPEITPPEGYGVRQWIYSGFNEDNEYINEEWNFAENTVDYDIKLIAVCVPYITVTFDTQGRGTTPEPVQLLRFEYLTSLPTQSAGGYCLTGWYYDEECTDPVTIETDYFWESRTIYAKWEQLKATGSDLPVEPEYPITGKYRDDMIWSLDADGTMTISKSDATVGDYSYSDYIDRATKLVIGEGITSIADRQFYMLTNLKEVVLTEGVTHIGAWAFEWCNNLETFIMSDTVVSIGDSAFWECESLSTLVLSNNLESIGDCAFDYCMSLTEVVIPDSVTEMIGAVFANCTSLKTVEFPANITAIPYYVFSNCTALETVTIPQAVTSIGENAFVGCESLKEIRFEGSRSQWAQVTIESGNETLDNVTMVYGKYDITVQQSENGTVSVDKTTATAGETVTVTAEPVGCYKLDTIYVNGTAITGNTFTAQEDSVVSATFVESHTADEAVAENEIPATCTVSGSYDSVIYCTECGTELSRENVPVVSTGHTSGPEYEENYVAPTCAVDGSYEIATYCAVCNEELGRIYETVPALGHTEETIPGTPATGTTTGLTDGVKCSVCGEILEEQQIIPVIRYTVKFIYHIEHRDDTYDTVVLEEKEVAPGTKIEEPTGFIPEGYGAMDDYWNYYYVSETGSGWGASWNFEEDVIEGDTELTIYLAPYMTVTFDTQGKGETPAPAQVVRYRYLDSLPTGEADGYCLTGWYYEPECINVVTIETDRFHYDTTIYAKWEKLKATATDLPTEPNPDAPVVTPDTTITEDKASEEVVEVVKENVVVEENKATLNKETVEAVVNATTAGETVVLPLAQTTEETVTEAVVDTQALQTVADSNSDIVIELTDVTVKLDSTALAAVTDQADGENIEIKVVKVAEETLTAQQQAVLEDKETAVIVTAQIYSDDEYIGDFEGGSATIMLPFTPAEGTVAEDYAVYYIADDGTLEKVNAEYVNGYLVFATSHFSDYVIVNEKQPDEVIRVKGKNRYATSFAIAKETKAKMGVDKFSTIIIASGENFADALAGSYLAKVKGAPILMASGKDANIADIKAFVQSNLKSGGMVYILGGTAAVNQKTEDTLNGISGVSVKRLKGKNRYLTNIEILKEAGVTNQDILVATGTNFADSLSASAAGKPILLVNGKGSLSQAQKNYLNSLSTNNLYILGGTGAVGANYESELASYGRVERIKGASRHETSVAIANKFFTNPTSAVVADAWNFPDGLCGGPLANTMNAPLILTKSGSYSAAKGYMQANGISSGAVLGGTARIDDASAKAIFGVSKVTVK